MNKIRLLALLLTLLSTVACQKTTCSVSYPEIIIKNGLQESYDQAKLDWYLLNATDSYSKSDYLVITDSIVRAGIRVRDSTDSFWMPDYQLIESKRKMLAKFGADRVLEFVATDIDLFVHEEESMIMGDTLTLTFFPEDNRKGWITDPTDGAIHTLIYVNGILKTVGQNDYIEYDVDAEKVAQERTVLIDKVRGSATVTEWLKCQLLN